RARRTTRTRPARTRRSSSARARLRPVRIRGGGALSPPHVHLRQRLARPEPARPAAVRAHVACVLSAKSLSRRARRHHTMAKLTSAALAAHELGLAATFGGILFGETGLGKAVKVLPDEADRCLHLDQGWR